MTERETKIKELKSQVEIARSELADVLANKPQEKIRLKEWQRSVAVMNAALSQLRKELEITVLNRLESKFFSFQPTPPNRRMRRQARRRKG